MTPAGAAVAGAGRVDMPIPTAWLGGRSFAYSLAASVALHVGAMLGIPVVPASDAGTVAPPRLALTVALAAVEPATTAVLPAHAILPEPAVREPAAPQALLDPPPDLAAPVSDMSAATGLPAPEPHYYSLAELDAPPLVVEDIPTDPPELRQYPQGGKLVVQLWIDETGHVVRVDSLTSELPEVFAASARESFLRAAFAPARKDGVAVRARLKVGIQYRARQIPP